MKGQPYEMINLHSDITSLYLKKNEILESVIEEKTLGKKELEELLENRVYFAN